MNQVAAIGRIVHFVLPSGRSAGEHRPAIIVRVWPQSEPGHGGTVQLQVFTDSDKDGRYNDELPPVMWATSVVNDEIATKPGTWHWPERE